MPVPRPTPGCIWNSFRASGKRHLLLTGGRGSGKTTLLSALCPEPLPGVTTWADPGKAVYLREENTGRETVIGRFDPTLPGLENKMQPVLPGLQALGVGAMRRCVQHPSPWVRVDEIGYLELTCPEYCQALRQLFEEKQVLAAVRKQDAPFLRELLQRQDVFVVDLDDPYGSAGCVLMASGLGRRFGGSKLMVPFLGKPLLYWALSATEGLFSRRVVGNPQPGGGIVLRRPGGGDGGSRLSGTQRHGAAGAGSGGERNPVPVLPCRPTAAVPANGGIPAAVRPEQPGTHLATLLSGNTRCADIVFPGLF